MSAASGGSCVRCSGCLRGFTSKLLVQATRTTTYVSYRYCTVVLFLLLFSVAAAAVVIVVVVAVAACCSCCSCCAIGSEAQLLRIYLLANIILTAPAAAVRDAA